MNAPVDPAGWREFLDREVTPRFPDGLIVFDAYGQWLSREQAMPGRLRSKLLVILHPDTPEHRARIDADSGAAPRGRRVVVLYTPTRRSGTPWSESPARLLQPGSACGCDIHIP